MNTPSPVESIFFAALGKKTTVERADYLDHACGSDAELRRRVERLLMAHPQAADFMARPAVERPGDDTLDREPHPPGLRPDPDLIRSLVQRVDSYRSEPSLPVFLWLGRAVSDRLAITEGAGARRYIWALMTLKSILAAMPGGRGGP